MTFYNAAKIEPKYAGRYFICKELDAITEWFRLSVDDKKEFLKALGSTNKNIPESFSATAYISNTKYEITDDHKTKIISDGPIMILGIKPIIPR